MSDCVLDASAVLALLYAEPGVEAVQAALPGALLSAVNAAEVIAKLTERGVPADKAAAAVDWLGLDVVSFDLEQARLAGELRLITRAAGLSLGDRACLALARLRGLPAMTADSAWAKVPGVDVIVIRNGGV